jgi:hypothetical protein
MPLQGSREGSVRDPAVVPRHTRGVRPKLPAIGAALGAAAGLAYYLFIGCHGT